MAPILGIGASIVVEYQAGVSGGYELLRCRTCLAAASLRRLVASLHIRASGGMAKHSFQHGGITGSQSLPGNEVHLAS